MDFHKRPLPPAKTQMGKKSRPQCRQTGVADLFLRKARPSPSILRGSNLPSAKNPVPWKANGAKGMAPPVSCHLAPPSRTSRPPQKKSHLRSPMHRLSEGTSHLKAPSDCWPPLVKKPEPFVGRMASKRISLAHGILCNKPPPHAYITFARYLSRRRHIPMSTSLDAYVVLATCPCHSHHIRNALFIGVPGARFSCFSAHFRHEMRIFPASEGVFRGGQ